MNKIEELNKYLKENNVGLRSFYPALHTAPVHNLHDKFRLSEKAAKKGLWLPTSSKLSH